MAEAASGIRSGETAVALPPAVDAGLIFIGRIRTPWTSRADCPRQGDADAGPACRIEIFAPFVPALDGIEAFERLTVVYWLHAARRDLVRQVPHGSGGPRGTFAIRSPVRPNPIGLSQVRLLSRTGSVVEVRGLDCLDGTPLLDLKPDRCPLAAHPASPGSPRP